MKRYAANEILIEGKAYSPGLIEVENGEVISWQQLEQELAMTEWLGGTVTVIRENGKLTAYKDGKKI
ncbi:hypothetical protein [Prevotella sp. HUN102]|uniref:hypothetical protein n=1 Tax=Prevotella sp. HUN102 TaxID=1392486 RepID=UPI00048FF526|nr:hypothetical protein [Prevotella sp. HUN102]